MIVKIFKFIKIFTAGYLCCIGLFLAAPVNAEVAVIVHPSNNSTLDRKMIQWLFLGKKKSFTNNAIAIPVYQEPGSTARQSFTTTILKKTEKQLKSYWSKQLFTGKGMPPEEISNDAAVKQYIANNPAGIGYIDASKIDNSVRVVLTF